MDPEEGKPDPGAEEGGEGKETPVMSCRGACTLLDGKGARTGGGEASLELWQNNLSLLLPGGGGCTLTYREILHIDSGDYRVTLTGAAGERVHLFHLGYNYEDFLRSLYRLRGEVILKDMLMQEQVSKAGLQGEYSYADEKGALMQKGPCEPRVYETGLVIIPQMEDPRRIPFSEIESIAAENHGLTLTTSTGETIAFSMMGSHLDPLEKALTGAMNRLNRETEKTLRELFPALEPASAGRAAALLRDGRAAASRELRSRFIGRVSHSSPEQWQRDAADLLQFNIDAENDGELWGKRGDQAAV